jgi:seryl-tRNA synthetase
MSEVQDVQENKVVEEAVADEATQSNEAVGSLIAESKKYRTRAQSAEQELNELKKLIATKEEEQLAEQGKWKEIAENYKKEIDSLSTIKADYDQIQMQRAQRKEHLLSQLPDAEQEIYNELSLEKLERHLETKSKNKVLTDPGKEVTASGKFASATKFSDITDEDRKKMKRDPKLWQQIVEGYRN